MADKDYAPLVYPHGKVAYEGLELEILEEIAKNQKFSYQVRFVGYNQAFYELEKGNADGAIGGFALTEEKTVDFAFAEEVYERDGIPFGMLLARDEKTLLTKYNTGLSNIKKSGIYDKILEKYTHKEMIAGEE
ncbi:MAG TPA: transporter substrate-binding domain-containing protein [Lachnospiraceae bacterium]